MSGGRAPIVVLVALSGCGRLDFTELPSGDARSSDAPVVPYCASLVPKPTFCDDFESRTTTAWTGATQILGTVDVSTGELVIVAPAQSGATSVDAHLEVLLGTATSVSASFDMSAPVSGSHDPVLLEIQFSSADQHGIEYVHRLPVPYVEEYVQIGAAAGSYYSYGITGTSDAGAHHIEFDVVMGVGAHLRVDIDGVTRIDTNLVGTSGGSIRFLVGIPYLAGPAPAWEIHLDNIVLDVRG